MTTTTTVTQSQIEACSRHLDEQGKAFYTVKSASDPDGFYTLRYVPQYRTLQCNCAAGREGRSCWHKHAVLAAEQEYQASRRIERDADLEDALASRSPEEVSEQAAIQSYVNQGVDRATAERVTYAPNAAKMSDQPKGGLGYFHTTGFALLK